MPTKDDVSKLTLLGSGHTEYPDKVDAALLESFPNRYPDRPYLVRLDTTEFTSLCPKTGQPDFGRITIEYVPLDRIIESKSLKLYLFSYRNEPTFMESVVNAILDDLVAACSPRSMTVVGDFAPRGGIGIRVEARFEKEGV